MPISIYTSFAIPLRQLPLLQRLFALGREPGRARDWALFEAETWLKNPLLFQWQMCAQRHQATSILQSDLLGTNTAQEVELSQWRSALAGVANSGAGSGPEAVLALLAELRAKLAAATERAGEKEAEARGLQGEACFFCRALRAAVKRTPPALLGDGAPERCWLARCCMVVTSALSLIEGLCVQANSSVNVCDVNQEHSMY